MIPRYRSIAQARARDRQYKLPLVRHTERVMESITAVRINAGEKTLNFPRVYCCLHFNGLLDVHAMPDVSQCH